MEKLQFINLIKEGASNGRRQYGILPSLTMAQAILESGWGSSELSEKANNLFGIKAFSDWTGRKLTLVTTEYYEGQMKIVNADFRAYDSFKDSIEDHNKLLSFTRYNPVRQCTNYREACQEIYYCGYATDPQYSEKLIKIIEDNKLYEFDDISVKDKEIQTDEVRRFQELCNRLNIRDYEGKPLVEDNILGNRTLSCLSKMPVLRKGSKGIAVEFVQEFLKAEPVDGDFGPITEGCVIEFQKGRNIEVDGIVGLETWTTLVS